MLDTQYNPGVANGAKYDITKLDSSSATSGQAPIFNGTAVAWATPAVAPGAITLTNAHILVGSAANLAADVAMSGDATMANTGALTIANSAITNAKVDAAAAIDFSKLATLASGNLLVGSVGGVATSVAMSGDATIIASGALTIANSAITNVKVDAAAAIDFSKLAALTSANILVGSAGNVATSVAMSGDATISNTGVVTVTGAAGTFAAIGNIEATGGVVNPGGTLVAPFYPLNLPQALSAPGAANITAYQTLYTSTGTGDVVTLANATHIGHVKKITYVAEGGAGDTAVVTPATASGFTTATLNAIGDYVVLMWNGAAWIVLEDYGATIA